MFSRVRKIYSKFIDNKFNEEVIESTLNRNRISATLPDIDILFKENKEIELSVIKKQQKWNENAYKRTEFEKFGYPDNVENHTNLYYAWCDKKRWEGRERTRSKIENTASEDEILKILNEDYGFDQTQVVENLNIELYDFFDFLLRKSKIKNGKVVTDCPSEDLIDRFIQGTIDNNGLNYQMRLSGLSVGGCSTLTSVVLSKLNGYKILKYLSEKRLYFMKIMHDMLHGPEKKKILQLLGYEFVDSDQEIDILINSIFGCYGFINARWQTFRESKIDYCDIYKPYFWSSLNLEFPCIMSFALIVDYYAMLLCDENSIEQHINDGDELWNIANLVYKSILSSRSII